MSRQGRRRRQLDEPEPELADRPINEARLRQLYATLTCRRRPILQDLVVLGIEVEAATPEELVEKTEHVIAEMTRQQRPS